MTENVNKVDISQSKQFIQYHLQKMNQKFNQFQEKIDSKFLGMEKHLQTQKNFINKLFEKIISLESQINHKSSNIAKKNIQRKYSLPQQQKHLDDQTEKLSNRVRQNNQQNNPLVTQFCLDDDFSIDSDISEQTPKITNIQFIQNPLFKQCSYQKLTLQESLQDLTKSINFQDIQIDTPKKNSKLKASNFNPNFSQVKVQKNFEDFSHMLNDLKKQMDLMNYQEFDDSVDQKVDRLEDYLIQYQKMDQEVLKVEPSQRTKKQDLFLQTSQIDEVQSKLNSLKQNPAFFDSFILKFKKSLEDRKKQFTLINQQFGTTKFDELLLQLDTENIAKIFKIQNIQKIYLQKGISQLKFQVLNKYFDVHYIKTYNDYLTYLSQSQFMICHCGAGTILDCIKNGVNVIAVVNENLMDNHQVELFDEMQYQKYITGFTSYKSINAADLKKCFEFFQNKENKKFTKNKVSIIDKISLKEFR